MTKTFVRVFLVALLSLAATGCTAGRYLGANPYPGPLGQAIAGNLGLTCPGDYFVGAPFNRCLGSLAGNSGSYSGYSLYRGGSDGPQLSPADKLSVFCGLGGSGVAMLLDASLKKIVGAGLVSAASCELAGALLSRRGGNQNVQQRTLPDGRQIPIITTYTDRTGTTSIASPPLIQEVPSSLVSGIRSCWDPALRGQYGEWYNNTGSNTPTMFTIKDNISGLTICVGVLKAGSKQMGPAIWAHKTATSEWVVTGTSYVSITTSDRTQGVVDDSPVRLEYVRNDGWHTRCSC